MIHAARWKRVRLLVSVALLAMLHAGCQQTASQSNFPANYGPGAGYQMDPSSGAAMRPGQMPGAMAMGANNMMPGGLTLAQYSVPADKNPMVPGSGLVKPGSAGPYVKPLEGADAVYLTPGCSDMMPGSGGSPPTELNLVSMAPYTVAPPDILVIDAPQLFPRSYLIQPFDVLSLLLVQPSSPTPDLDPTKKALKDILLSGDFKVSPEGKIMLPILGSPTAIPVAGMTIEQATKEIHRVVKGALVGVDVFLELKTYRPIAQFQKAEYLVRPDGTIGLGSYGYVYVAGMTLGQIKTVIEKHLSQYVTNPVIAVDVRSYNSKKYYLIIDGGGYGQLVFAYPHTGYETVLDAVSKLQGLPWWASKKKIWVARPAPCCNPCSQILPVDWNALTQGGVTCTNWQLMPGDRIFVRADCLVEVNNWITKVLSPINQVMNSTLLGASTYNSIINAGKANNGGNVGFVAAIP